MSRQHCQSGLWRISSPYAAPVTLRATDWISALGGALSQLGRADHIDRLASERLPNGEYIINDLTHGRRYIVQQLAGAADLSAVAPEEEITEVGIQSPLPQVEEGDDSDAVLAMDDAVERTDPYAGWGMSLAIDQSEEPPSEEKPVIETYNHATPTMAAAPMFEDAFAFSEDDLSDLPETNTLAGQPAHRRLSSALERFKQKRRE